MSPRWTSDFSETPSGIRLKNINVGVLELVDETGSKTVGCKRFGGSSPSHIVRIAPQKRCYPLDEWICHTRE